MSRRRDDYERSWWRRFKEWVHGETDLLVNGMEIQIPKELEALEKGSARAGDTGRNDFQENENARFQENGAVRFQENGNFRFQKSRDDKTQENRQVRDAGKNKSQERGRAKVQSAESTEAGQRFQNMRGLRWFRRIYQVMSVILCMSIIFVLLWTIAYLPAFGNAGNPDNNEVSARYIERGLQETGAVNIVTGMILDYRAFDTFGESCVLFIASCCVLALLRIDVADKKGLLQSDAADRKGLLQSDAADRKGLLQSDAADRKRLLRMDMADKKGQLRAGMADEQGQLPNSGTISKNKKEMEKHTEPDNMSWAELARRRLEASNDRLFEPKDDLILQKCACVLVPLIFVFGIYIVLNGHLSPGGGFSGGAVLGSGLILYLNAFGFKKTEEFFTEKVYRRLTLSALTFYCVAKSYSFFTGANHLESGIPLGTPGAILSSGLILPLNICVGLVVACTMYAFYALFRKGGM